MHQQKKAFTLVELIVVITILAILGTIAIMAFGGYSKNARDSARISDIGSMKKGLELWLIKSGNYPEPSNGTTITYSGAGVWTQGTYGNTVNQTVGTLDKKPTDPLYETEYTYSVAQSKKEYQLGAVLESQLVSINIPVPINQTYAATEIKQAYVSGNYNGIVTSTQTGSTYYILAVPSIILSDIGDATLIGTKQFVLHKKTNLPSSYANKNLTMTGTEVDFTPVVVWSGTGYTNLNNQTNFETLVTNLQNAFSGVIFQTLPEYKSISTTETLSNAAMTAVKSIIETGTKQQLTSVTTISTITYSCTGSLVTANADITNTTGLTANTPYQTSNLANQCYYTCKVNYSGTNCEIYTGPFVCGISTVSAGGFTYTTLLGPDGKCWTSTNMKHGNMLANPSTMPSNTNVIEKWCYNNDSNICNTDGALYTWSEAMGFPASCNTTNCTQVEDTTKSVCGALGTGWVLPTNAEWVTLTNAGATGWDGNKLSGIVSVLPGYRHASNVFSSDRTVSGYRWTSTQVDNNYSWYRTLNSGNMLVNYLFTRKLNGVSIVCIKN